MTEGRPFILNQVRQPRRGDALPFAAGPPGPKAVITGCQQIANGVRVHVLGSVAVNCGGTQAVATGDGAEGEGVREQFGLDRCALRMGTCCAWPRHPSTLHRGRLAGLRMPTGLPRPGFYRCPAPCRTTPTSVNAAGPPACGCRARVRRAPYRVRSQSPAASFRRGTPALRLGGGRRVGAAGALVMAAVTIVADGHADDRAADGNSRNICTRGAPGCPLAAGGVVVESPLRPGAALSGSFSCDSPVAAVPVEGEMSNSSSSCTTSPAAAGLPMAGRAAASGVAALAPSGTRGVAEVVTVLPGDKLLPRVHAGGTCQG